MQFKSIKIKWPILSLRYVYVVAYLIIAAAVIALIFFLYSNFYQTITQSQEVVILKQEVAPDTININKVNAVLQTLDKKTNATSTADWQAIKNPFTSAAPQATAVNQVKNVTPTSTVPKK